MPTPLNPLHDIELVGLEKLMSELYPECNWQQEVLSELICRHDLQAEYLEVLYEKVLARIPD